jgi:tetraacyldisaccharide 4'-kinase
MFNTIELLEIISGRRNDFTAIITRWGLGLLTPGYRAAVWLRNKRFDVVQNSVRRVSVPVISIGNLTTGGTGKTPFVAWICKLLQTGDKRVAVLSRGYARHNTGATLNDEALELKLRLPNVIQLQDPDRFRIAQTAIEGHGSEIIVLDDGFQHRQLGRDLDLVLIDATQPFGFGRLLPRGLLREPVSSLARADAIVLTRANAVDDVTRRAIFQRVRAANADALWVESRTSASHFAQSDGTRVSLDHLRGKQVLAFCGIGNPAGFSHSLAQLQLITVSRQQFPDHHRYTDEDLKRLGELAARVHAEAIICTQKDLVKIGVKQLEGVPLYALVVDIELLEGEVALIQKIRSLF